MQLTILIADNKTAKLVSYTILDSSFDVHRQSQIDCSIFSKEYKLMKGSYVYQIGPGE